MSKKKKKINNTAEEIKDVVTETEVSLDELDKFEPDVKEQHHTPETAPKKVEEADNSPRAAVGFGLIHNRRGRSSRFD